MYSNYGGVFGNFDFSNLNNISSQSEDELSVLKNSNYTSDERQGTVNTKSQNASLDTTEYDAKLNDYNSLLSNLQSRYLAARWNPDPDKPTEAANLKRQIQQLQSQIASVTNNKSGYLDQQANRTNLDKATTQADQALASAQQSGQAEAAANKKANINAGINKSAAGMLGSQAASTGTSQTANNLAQANSSNAASTQADYLEKMAQANAADAMASNLSKSAGLAAFSGGLQGASSGASMGAVISDEKCKQPSDGIDEDELRESIKRFKALYKELKELRKGR